MADSRPTSTRYRALIQLLRTAEDLWNANRVFFARWKLSPSQFNLLNLLSGEPDGLSQSSLSRLLIMHRSNATGLVDRLEERGLVVRRNHPEDRRAYQVILSPKGTELLQEIYPHYYAAADRVWADIPEDRVSQLLDELQGLAREAAAVASDEAPALAADPAPSDAAMGTSRKDRATNRPDDGLRTTDL